jgi:hypothetical protein
MITPKLLTLSANGLDEPEAKTGLRARDEPKTFISANRVIRLKIW